MANTVPRELIAWIFDNLNETPFGVLPLKNLNSSGGPTVIENYAQIGSYNWLMDETKDGKSTLVQPGAPRKFQTWNGGRLNKDEGPILYDVNHMKSPDAPLDPIFLTLKSDQFDFQQFDLITDAINLVKLFAFTKGAGGGMFRIDFERIGRTILANRVEAADVVPIDFMSFDLAFRDKCTQTATTSKILEGPYQQLAKYQLGQLNVLVRFEPECADYSKSIFDASKAIDQDHESRSFDLNNDLRFMKDGKRASHYELITTIAYPQSEGFPDFTYSKLFFTGIDRLLVGLWRGPGDFAPPKSYTMSDMIKVIKPQQAYNQISKTYDCLLKMINLLRKNPEALKISLVWTGSDFVEMYEKAPDKQPPISDSIRAYLKTQVTQQMPGDIDELDNVDN